MALINDQYTKEFDDELIVEQWGKVVEMADTTIDKRINSSNVYMTIEVALVAVISFVSDWWNYAVAFVGVIVACIWFLSVRSYRAMSKAKYDVINEIEQLLPIKPFKYEWELLKANKTYRQVTGFERCMPIVFGILYVAIIVGLIITGKSIPTA